MNRRLALQLFSIPLVALPVLSGCSSNKAPQSQSISITIANGKATPKGERFEVRLGGKVTVTATSDQKDEVHVHGYEKVLHMKGGDTQTVEFTADTPGVFEIESHGTNTIMATLAVKK